MINIDGSYGEGGGQLLRTALSLSVILQKPFRIFKIRANRPKPGLQHQHLTCVKALAEISGAYVEGAKLHSQEIKFFPKKIKKKTKYIFDIKTAGSTSLLFQTLLYPLALSHDAEVILKGGTHVPYSPPFHYLKYVFSEVIKHFGLEVDLEIIIPGFYPKGGGEIKAKIKKWERFSIPIFSEGFSPDKVFLISLITKGLPEHILKRQADSANKILKKYKIFPEIKLEKVKSVSEGTMCFVWAEDKLKRAGFTTLGKKGLSAEKVGETTALEFLEFLNTNTQVEEHLGDQLLIPISIAIINSKENHFNYTVSKITKHLITQVWVIKQFIPEIEIKVIGEIGKKGKVEVYKK